MLLGLLKRKEIWAPTVCGWVILLGGSLASAVLAVGFVHQFLALNAPLGGDILVVEGWLPDYALQQAVREFDNSDYRLLVTTGGPLSTGYHLSKYKTHAELSADILKKMDLEANVIIAVPAPYAEKHRTFISALALKKWLLTH